MNKLIAKLFSKEEWLKSGNDWMRQTKNKDCTGLVIGDFYDSKIEKMKFKFAEYEFSLYYTISNFLSENDVCAIGVKDFSYSKMTAGKYDKDLYTLVYPILNLKKRAEIANKIERKEYFSSNIIIGSKADFKHFSNFYHKILESNIFDKNYDLDSLILNIFASEYGVSHENSLY